MKNKGLTEMKKYVLLFLLFCGTLFGQTTDRFERPFYRSGSDTLITGASIYIVNSSTGDSLLLTEHATKPGVYYRNSVAYGSYKIYVNGALSTSSYPFGISRARSFIEAIDSDGNNKIESGSFENGAIAAADLNSTLDLSGKSVTLAAGEVSASELAGTLDLSGKNIALPTNVVNNSTVSESTLTISRFTPAAINFMGSGGTVTNNPDDVSLENKTGSTLGIKDNYVLDNLRLTASLKSSASVGGEVTLDYESSILSEAKNDTFSVREHSVVWHPIKNKYYLVGDVIDTANTNHPNTYNTELGLWSSADLTSWTYHGICVPKPSTGTPGSFGIASPSSIAYKDSIIYVGYSQRNNVSFGNRDIGLSISSSDPETIPWTRVGTISNTAGEDDDASLVFVPGDKYLHVYHRTTAGGYQIMHSKSATPTDTSSWTIPVTAAGRPAGISATENTGVWFVNGALHMFNIEQSPLKIAHLVSVNPDSVFSQADDGDRYLSGEPSGIFSSGHIGLVVRDGAVEAFSWNTTDNIPLSGSKGSKYSLDFYKAKNKSRLTIDQRLQTLGLNYKTPPNPRALHLQGNNTDFVIINNSDQITIADGEPFTIAFRYQLNDSIPLSTTSHQYMLAYKGQDGANGTWLINNRGSSTYKGVFFRIVSGDGNNDIVPSVDQSTELTGGKPATIVVTRQSDNYIRLYLNGELVGTSSDTVLAGLDRTANNLAIGNGYSANLAGTTPYHGFIYEFAMWNKGLNSTDVSIFTNYGVQDVYSDNSSETGCIAHYIFDMEKSRNFVLDATGYGNQGNIQNYSSSFWRGIADYSSSDAVFPSSYLRLYENNDQFVVVPHSDQLVIPDSGQFTIAAKLRLDDNAALTASGDNYQVFWKGTNNVYGNMFMALRGSVSYNGLRFAVVNSSNTTVAINPTSDISTSIAGGKNIIIAATREADQVIRLYLNGTKVGESAANQYWKIDSAHDLAIGNDYSAEAAGSTEFNGAIYEVAWWNRGLTSAGLDSFAISGVQYYDAYADQGNQTGCIFHLKFNQQSLDDSIKVSDHYNTYGVIQNYADSLRVVK